MTEIIIALDRMSKAKAIELAKSAKDLVWGFKVNDLILHYGAEIVYELRKYGHVMADPKLFDIPNTIHNSISILKSAGASIITVHASSFYVPQDNEKELLAGITILTSSTDEICKNVYNKNLKDKIFDFSVWLISHRYKYLVCSGQDLSFFGPGIQKICPGIRPAWYQSLHDDQVRTTTPREAKDAGADFIVIGRPLVEDPSFVEAIERTKDELSN